MCVCEHECVCAYVVGAHLCAHVFVPNMRVCVFVSNNYFVRARTCVCVRVHARMPMCRCSAENRTSTT